MPCRSGARSGVAKVGGQRTCDRRQEGQENRHTRFGASHPERASPPIDVVETDRGDLSGTHAVRGHEKKKRVVPSPYARGAHHRPEQPDHRGPWKTTRRLGSPSNARCLDRGCQIGGHPPGRVQESQEGSDARARVGDHDTGVASALLHDEGVDVGDPHGCQTSVPATKESQESRRLVALLRDRPLANATMAALMTCELSQEWWEHRCRPWSRPTRYAVTQQRQPTRPRVQRAPGAASRSPPSYSAVSGVPHGEPPDSLPR